MSKVEERYLKAAKSSHLKCDEHPGDIDTLIAAGMLRDSLGVDLLRLRAEYDSIRSMPGARVMMTRLKSAGSVRTKMLALVIDRNGPTGAEAADLVAALLDKWCDPSCPSCTGRGSVGGYGTPQLICTACNGSTRRRLLWPVQVQAFAEMIEGEMLAKVDAAERRMRLLLRD